MSKMTGKELVEFARGKIGTDYVYGMKGEVMTAANFNYLYQRYKDFVPYADKKKVGKVCVDCSGLISWACGKSLNSAGWKRAADETHPIATLKDAPLGALVWKEGHIGIYSGIKDGLPHYIAAESSRLGVREFPITANRFTHWLLVRDVFDYEEEDNVTYYENLKDIPKWAQPMIKDMIEKGCFADEKKLHLSDDMIRVLALMERKMK